MNFNFTAIEHKLAMMRERNEARKWGFSSDDFARVETRIQELQSRPLCESETLSIVATLHTQLQTFQESVAWLVETTPCAVIPLLADALQDIDSTSGVIVNASEVEQERGLSVRVLTMQTHPRERGWCEWRSMMSVWAYAQRSQLPGAAVLQELACSPQVVVENYNTAFPDTLVAWKFLIPAYQVRANQDSVYEDTHRAIAVGWVPVIGKVSVGVIDDDWNFRSNSVLPLYD